MEHAMKCKKVKPLLAPYVLGDLADDLKLLGRFEEHLRNCDCCSEESRSIRQTISFVEEHRDIFVEVFAEIDLERAEKEETQKQNYEEIFEEVTEKPKNFRFLFHIGTVAACFVIGLLIWVIYSNHSNSQSHSQNISSRQAASESRVSVKVELVKPSGNIVIDADQTILADSGRKELRINGKHRMMMNVGTSLSIEPLLTNSRLGCLVKLTHGEIYTHVEHDGNPFVVETNSGKLELGRVQCGQKEFIIQRSLFEERYIDIHKRNYVCSDHKMFPDRYAMGLPTCIPGTRRCYVSVDGSYYPCERTPECNQLKIGNVRNGIDVKKVYALYRRFFDSCKNECKYCWLLGICQVGCFANIFDQECDITEHAMKNFCAWHRRSMHRRLTNYCAVMEKNPKAFDYLKNVERV